MQLRMALAEDVPEIMRLIKELAEFERAPEQVTNTEEMMLKDGFGSNPAFECILIEENDEILGLALYFIQYSTWKGRRLYLEDLIVTEKQRRRGIGKMLFDATINKAKKLQCVGMMWQVLDWNINAIDFYKKNSTRLDSQWINCHLDEL